MASPDLSKLSDADLEALARDDYGAMSDEGLSHISGEQPPEKGVGDYARQGLDYAGRGLDYLGGLSRGGIAGLLEGATGKELVDAKDVLRGQAPTSAEILQKLGAEEGGKLSDLIPMYAEQGKGGTFTPEKGGSLDPSLRGAAGFALDTASDPLTYLSLGSAPAIKAAKLTGKAAKGVDLALNPLQRALEAAGKKSYAGGLKAIDARILEKGGDAVSPYLMERGVWGRLPAIEKGIEQGIEEVSKRRQALYEAAPSARVDPYTASQPALERVAELEKNPYMREQANKQLDFLGQATEPMTLSEASAVKSDLYNSLPANAFDEGGRLTNEGKKNLKALSTGYKTAIESAAEAHTPGLGKQISDVNKEWGAYIAAQKPTRSEIKKEANKNLITQVKAAMSFIDPRAAAAMVGAQVANSSALKTGGGLALKAAGKNVPEGVWKRMLINSLKNKQETKK